jgi:NAD(P)H-flavin reductase
VPIITVPVGEIVAVTPRTRLVLIDLQGRAFEFHSGQAIRLGPAGSLTRRPYSIACSPKRVAKTGRLELLVALEGSTLGPALNDAKSGTLVDIEGPFGTFTFPSRFDQRYVLFVAGGAGIAPLRAMLDDALQQDPAPEVSVVYSARSADEFAFIEELRALARAERITLYETVTRDPRSSWEGGRGRVGRLHLEAALRVPGETLCFVCGPRPMVDESVRTLELLGVPPDLIRTERWSSQEDE